jgi:hypothetical protein
LKLLDADYSAYRASLKSAGGEEIYAWQRLTPKPTEPGGNFFLIIPARKFVGGGDYILTLKGIHETGEVEDISKSLFRVERK